MFRWVLFWKFTPDVNSPPCALTEIILKRRKSAQTERARTENSTDNKLPRYLHLAISHPVGCASIFLFWWVNLRQKSNPNINLDNPNRGNLKMEWHILSSVDFWKPSCDPWPVASAACFGTFDPLWCPHVTVGFWPADSLTTDRQIDQVSALM